MNEQLELKTGQTRVKCLVHKRHHDGEDPFRPEGEIRFFIRTSKSAPDSFNIYTYCDDCFRIEGFARQHGVGDHEGVEHLDKWTEVDKERGMKASRAYNREFESDRVIDV